jgi:WD repeat-containing protein 90
VLLQCGPHFERREGSRPLQCSYIAAAVGHDIFTDLAYERGTAADVLGHDRHVFVSAVSGCIYRLNYDKHCLEAVYHLHVGAINTLAVNEGFAITGSDDKYLRVWPIDFSDYFLEAEHETPVTSVGVSPDGLQVRQSHQRDRV